MGYEAHRDAAAKRQREQSRAARDIGPIPKVKNKRARAAATKSLREFCETCFPERFPLAWSPDHLEVLRLAEDTVRTSGRLALAMPRGSGKTTIAEVAALWSAILGLHPFTMLIGSTAAAADLMLKNVQAELLTNDRLLELFPEALFPFRALEGESRRAQGQLYKGNRTYLLWKADEVGFAMIPKAKAAGNIIRTAGLTGNIRGAKHARPDGRQVRPTLAILDDPQTDESAWSDAQSESRRRIIEGSVAGLAPPGQSCALVMPCTVIRRGDLADRMLDRQVSPLWRGIRTKLVYEWPKREDLWERYAELRTESLLVHEDLRLATAFYAANRDAMDEGSRVAWPERFDAQLGELSALQHAVNLRLRDAQAFAAEYQNEPIDLTDTDEDQLKADAIMRRTNGHGPRVVPADASLLTAFIDVQGKLLWYLVAAWAPNGTGYVVDYGTEPDQGRSYFDFRTAKRTLARVHPGAGLEAQLRAGLLSLTDRLLGSPWQAEDGSEVFVDLAMIDANWSPSTDVVYQVCRASTHAARIMPAHGHFYGASSKPLGEGKKRGDQLGHGWFTRRAENRGTRRVTFDTNHWKTWVASRLTQPVGGAGAMTLFGRDPERHRMLAEHLASETRVRVEGRGRTVDEWKQDPAKRNDWFDCLVGAAVAASVRGMKLEGQAAVPKRRRVRLSELAAAR